ncbi:MarR family winged helix-turn-helix transcriptional regulator [Streptomyces sp. P6-2-1]|uniref:MarR family winged helix-turn-helix transcriptional regulator n=1 Tax=Streptomyces sp. P6-2-1 TaxID=3422591 RepID=UPI003D36B292
MEGKSAQDGASSGPLPALFDDLVRCETRLYNAIGDRLQARHGLTTAQFEALRLLRARPGARVGELATAFVIGAGAASKVADRLVARGWARRRPNPQDRRSALLDLTPEGGDLVDAAETTFTTALAELLDPALDPATVAVVARALAGLRASLEGEGAGTPAG